MPGLQLPNHENRTFDIAFSWYLATPFRDDRQALGVYAAAASAPYISPQRRLLPRGEKERTIPTRGLDKGPRWR
jgi:hypothetical protein